MVATRLMTADELARLPEDDSHFELINGELVPMSPSGGLHFVIGLRLNMEIGAYIAQHPIGGLGSAEGGFLLERNRDTVLAPDFAFLTNEQIRTVRRTPEGFARVVPPLVIEVKSPTDREPAIIEKLGIYQAAGVTEIWWVRPDERSLTLHRLNHEPEVVRPPAIFSSSSVLPGLSIDLAALFDG